MSKDKGKSFLEDLKDSAKKPFKSRTKKSKKPSKNDITALYNKMPNYLPLSKLSASYGIYPYLDPLSVKWMYHMSQLICPFDEWMVYAFLNITKLTKFFSASHSQYNKISFSLVSKFSTSVGHLILWNVRWHCKLHYS